MAVLVTGGAGFIGSNLVDELMMQGSEVRVLDDMSEGKMENLSRWNNHKQFQMIRGSILDYDLVRRAADQVTCIFHLAADSRIQTGISDPRHSIETNVVGTANVAEAARQGGVPRIVYSASSSAYGKTELPECGFNELCKTDCLNPYSMSKKAGEEIMDVYNRLYNISTVSLRYFNVYGPRHQEEGRYSTVIAIFRRQLRLGKKMTIVGDGKQRRDFTFVGDVVRANMLAMMNRDATGIINIGTGKNYSINELAATVDHDEHGSNWMNKVEYVLPRLGEAQVTLADSNKAKDILGWYPHVNLRQGLEVLDIYERKMGFGSSKIILATS
jgi:UDP-glucose 4-epimerase